MAVDEYEDLVKKVVKWSLAAFIATFLLLVVLLVAL